MFGHGYDPVTGDFKGAVSQFTFTGLRGNDTFLNDWVHPTLNSVHSLPDQVCSHYVIAQRTGKKIDFIFK